MPIPGVLSGVLAGLGKAVIGGATSGLEKRISAQFAGKKGLFGTTEGTQNAEQARYIDSIGTNQARSQGQSEAFAANMEQGRMIHQEYMAQEAMRHEKEMMVLQHQLSREGDAMNGQLPWWASWKRPDFVTNAPKGSMIERHMSDPWRQ